MIRFAVRAQLRFMVGAAAALLSAGCSSSTDSTGEGGGGNTTPTAFTVTFSGSGHWEEAHPQLNGAPTRAENASVTWQIVYKVDFANRSVTTISRTVTGTGGAAYADVDGGGNPIVCSGAIVADSTQLDGPTLDLVSDAFPTDSSGSATFQTQAMGGSAFHLCDPAWATGIHQFPGYDNVRGDAQITINLPDWRIDKQAKTIYLPAVDAHETDQEITGAAPATLDVHWEGTFVISPAT